MSSFNWPVFQASITAPNLASLPATATDGALGVTTDTYSIYVFEMGTGWVLVTGSGAPISSMNTDSINTQIVSNIISSTVNLSSNAADAANTLVALDVESTGVHGLRAQVLNSNIQALFSASSPLLYSAGVFSIQVATAGQNGYLSSADFTTFNNKQPAGNYITALTGDATASGPGSAALTLATVNANVGSFGDASHSLSLTANAKGLLTAVSTNSIQIAESQVTNLVSDLAGKQPTGNYITALTGDVTATGPGSVAATLATVNGNVGSFGSSTSIPNFTVNGKGLITAAGGNAVIAPAGTLSGTTLNATVVDSSLTSVGTIATGVWNGTAVDAAHGGTGQTSLTANNVILGNGTSAVQFVAPGTPGNVLTDNGTTWVSSPGGGGGSFTGEVVVGSVQNSDSSLTVSTPASFATSPTLTFTATYTGKYLVYTEITVYGTAATMHFLMNATSGSPTAIWNGEYVADSSSGTRVCIYVYGIYSLTATQAYTFELQGYTGGGVIMTLNNSVVSSGSVVIAERLS